MQKIEVDCFEITESDGCGVHENHVAYASMRCVADAIASQNKGWRSVRPFKKTFVIVDRFDEYEALKKSNARAKALAKLTEEDIRALDL